MNEEQLKLVARPLTDRQWDLIADAFGEACHPRGSVDWLNSFITRQDLVDTFSESWPDVRGRFTCWDQYTNSRYVNEGSRIDMVLVDREWWLAQGERGEALSGAEMSELFSAGDDECASSVGKRKRNIASVDSLTYKSTVMMDQQLMNALRVCTANGLFRKAAYSGDGIPTATKVSLYLTLTTTNSKLFLRFFDLICVGIFVCMFVNRRLTTISSEHHTQVTLALSWLN